MCTAEAYTTANIVVQGYVLNIVELTSHRPDNGVGLH